MMKATIFDGRRVFLTEGGIVNVGQIYGVFLREEDVWDDDADKLAFAIVGPESLTSEQIQIAKANSEELATEHSVMDIFENYRIEKDLSGVGHCWRHVAGAEEVPATILEELEGEIFSGRESGEMIGTNGFSYRWSKMEDQR